MKRFFRGKLFFAVVAAALGAAAWLRFGDLGAKPLHADEAEQAYTLGRLLDGAGYRYNPVEHHGPALYYFAAAVCRLAGQGSYAALTASVVRLTPALFGMALVALPLLCLRRRRRVVGEGDGGGGAEIGADAVLIALALATVSPVAVYYARYFIQETMFAACFWAAVLLLWRALSGGAESPAARGALAAAAGAAFGLAAASKETWVLMAAAATAGACAVLAPPAFAAARAGAARAAAKAAARRFLAPVLIFGFAALVVAAAFFSSFGENPRGVANSVTTYFNYANKASGGAHEHPFGWHFKMLFDPVPFVRDTFVLFGADGRTLRAHGLGAVSGTRELFTGTGCLLALVFLFFPSGVWRSGERRAAVFALVSGGVLLLLYSAIAYKTPWLTLGVLPPLWLAAGLGFAALWRRCRAVRVAVPVVFAGALVAAGIGVHANAAHFLSRRFAADSRNPLAYVHTTDDAQNVALRARRLLAFASKTEPILVRVYVREYWPLPWYLKGTAGGVGFWRSVPAPDEGGETLDAPVVITDESTEEAVAPRLREKYVMDFMGLRPGVLLIVRLREDLHKRMLAAETP